MSIFYMDLGVSRGMEYGRSNARRAGRDIIERRLPGWEDALHETPLETLVRLGLYSLESIDIIASLPKEIWEPRLPVSSAPVLQPVGF